MAGDGFTYEPATIDAALKHFRNALNEQRGPASQALQRLEHVQRPGDAPATKMYDKNLHGMIKAQHEGVTDGITALEQVIEALEETKKQYERNEEITWQGLEGIEGDL
jgi:pyruvate-formate lyase